MQLDCELNKLAAVRVVSSSACRPSNGTLDRTRRLQHDLACGELTVGKKNGAQLLRVCGSAGDECREQAAPRGLAIASAGESTKEFVEPLVHGHWPPNVGLDRGTPLDLGGARDRLRIIHGRNPNTYDLHMEHGRTTAPEQHPLRLLTLNISGPSVARAERLTSFLAEVDADVVVLTETRNNDGTRGLLSWCRAQGYFVTGDLPESSGERGVAVVRRVGPDRHPVVTQVDLPHRLVIDELDDDPLLRLVAAYVPSRDASLHKIARKQKFLGQLSAALRGVDDAEHIVFMGDLNIVSRSHVPRHSAFKAWEYDALDDIAAGLTDVFAEINPGVQAYSWIGRTGSGYRYDYAFVSPELMDAVVGCEYLHEPRERGITDHAAVLLTMRRPGVGSSPAGAAVGLEVQRAG